MVGARHVITEGDGRTRADEHGAGVAKSCECSVRLGDDEQQMLRCVVVRERNRVGEGLGPQYRSLPRERLGTDRGPRLGGQ